MVTSESTASFGYWVRRRRLALDLTQDALARQVGCATVTIIKIERDERRPSRQMAELLAARLAIPADEHQQFLAVALGERSVDRLPVAQAPLGTASLPRTGLPQPATPFVGRRSELKAILLRLRDPACRLLTLVGPGGIGKTRLALEAARLANTGGNGGPAVLLFDAGIYFVPLQPVSSADRLIPAVFEALGLRADESEPPLQQVIHFLQGKQVLLVLDNFEHLVQGAGIVAAILADAPGVKVLATSREALKLHEEWFYPLAGLQLPPAADLEPADGAFTASEAVQLFVQAAYRAQPAFKPEIEQESITRICRLVDGIPLALELAAAWLKVLSCAQICAEIERSPDILVTRHQNVAERHRSMRSVLNQSWQLLSAAGQHGLRRLAVFQGGFQREAAVALGIDLPTLAELVDTAWLTRREDGRYQVHELLRQYAAEQLAGTPAEDTATRDKHMHFYLRQVAALEPALLGPQQRFALDSVASEINNIQVAWTRAADRDLALLGSVVHPLYLFFYMRSRFAEGVQFFAEALRLYHSKTGSEVSGGESPLRMRLLARLGSLQSELGDAATARACFQAVIDSSADPRERAFVHIEVGELFRRDRIRSLAEAELQAGLRLARAIDDPHLICEALVKIGDVLNNSSEYATAEQVGSEALALGRKLGRLDLVIRILAQLGWPAFGMGRYAEAERAYLESLVISEAIDNPYGIAVAKVSLAWIYSEDDARLSEAVVLCEQALTIWRRIGHRSGMATAMGAVAWLAYEQGDYAKAQHHAQKGLAVAEELGQVDQQCFNLCGLSAAACGLGKFDVSRRLLLRAIQQAYHHEILFYVNVSLYWFARLLQRECEMAALSLRTNRNSGCRRWSCWL